MISRKIKSIFVNFGVTQKKYADVKGISKAQLGNKIRNEAFSLKDIIELAHYFDGEVVIRGKNGKDIVVFNIEDIQE